MKISHKGPADADLAKAIQQDRLVRAAGDKADAKVKQASASTRVNISAAAREMQRVADLARDGDEARAEKVEAIKKQLAEGTYRPDSQEVAKSILRSEVARLLETD